MSGRVSVGDRLLMLVMRRYRLFMWLIEVGFIDGTSEAGRAFWRLDFWRAHYRRTLREPSYEWTTNGRTGWWGV